MAEIDWKQAAGETLRLVDSIHRDKGIDKEIIFGGIEDALLTAAKKYFGEEEDIKITIDRDNGRIEALHDGKPIDTEHLGRISAQSAKQIMIQKIREAERDALFDEYSHEKGTLITGTVARQEGRITIVTLGKTEVMLPPSESLPGESFAPGQRVRAVILDVRKTGQRIRIVLSRAHPDFVKRLFEQEIPEVADRVIEIRAIAREAGYRTKMAVSSIDSKVDCVGACVGVRGSRIKTVLQELGDERIDIIRYNESLQAMIPNALSPAQIEEVQIYTRLGRAIVLVKDDQLSLAIGKRGQNVRLASKLCGIDVEIMTIDELTEAVEQAEATFSQIPNLPPEAIDAFIEDGVFTFSDLSVMEPEAVMELAGVDEDQAFDIIEFAEDMEEQSPANRSSRSSILTTPSGGRSNTREAEQILGPIESIDKGNDVSARHLLGELQPQEAKEKKVTFAGLFGEDRPADADAGKPEEP